MSVRRFTGTYTQVLGLTTYTSVSNPIYNRVPLGNTFLCLSGSGTIRIYQVKDDLTPTWYLSYSDTPKAFDGDPSSYAYVSIPASYPETDALLVDFNTLNERYIHIRLSGSITSVIHRVYQSNDGSTWVKIMESTANTATSYFLKTTLRYLKITVQNAYTSSQFSFIHEIAGFSVSNPTFSKTITHNDGVVILETLFKPYWLWIDPDPVLTASVLERVPPSSASEVWIL